jgi:hypothetical protein
MNLLSFFGIRPSLDENAIRADERKRVARFIVEVLPVYDAAIKHTGSPEMGLVRTVIEATAKDVEKWDGVFKGGMEEFAAQIEARLKESTPPTSGIN